MRWVKSIGLVAFVTACSSMPIMAAQADKTQNLESILTAASEAQTKGDFTAAAGYYQQAVRISPDRVELWANLGLMNDLAGNPSEAIKSFGEAARLNGSMYVPQLFLGIENLKLNRAEAAIPYLQKAEKINPKDPQAPLALGRAFALSGKGDRASDAYSRAIDRAPKNGDAWLGLGMAEMQQSSADDHLMTETYKDSVYTKLRAGETFAEQGKLDRASDAYLAALTAKSSLPACVHADYGLILMRQQEVSKAHSEFENELKLNPGCNLARLGLIAISLTHGDSDGALKGLIALWNTDRGFLQENLPLLREMLSEEQRQQLLHIAESLEAQEDAHSAEFANGHQAEARSDRLKEAKRYYLSGQYQKCDESLRSSLNVLSEPSLLLLAPCASYTGDYKTASLAARRLKATAKGRASGAYWESKADQKLAIIAFADAGETASNPPQLHVLLGDIYRQKQRWEEAESEYRKALALEPHNQSTSLSLAMALFADEKSDEALDIDKELLMETPDNDEENLLAGEILVRGAHFFDAEIYLKKIPDSGQKFMPRVHTLLGQIYFATDRFPQALSEFQSSQLSDEDGSIHYQLGRIYQKLGDKEKAEEAFRISKQLRKRSDNPADLAPR
jgi:tetratricopeptide (TPR) repeat protein